MKSHRVDSEVAVEDRFRDILQSALGREGLSPSDLSREVGMDKAYFVDLLAGRKKTVSVLAFMLASKRLGLDPWELAGVERPSAVAMKSVPDEKQLMVEPVSSGAVRISGFGILEEGAFRASGRLSERTFAPVDGYAVQRQSVFEIRGHDYVSWGLSSGSIVHVVSFGRYEAVGVPGRLIVSSRHVGNLVEKVLRRIVVDTEGEMHLLGPMGDSVSVVGEVWSVEGMVVQTALPFITS
jgi:hypothetical protein